MPLNPLYGIISNFRSAMLGQAFDWYALSVSVGIALCMTAGSLFYFRRLERGFADII